MEHIPPSVPHAALELPGWQLPLESQQPAEQFDGEHFGVELQPLAIISPQATTSTRTFIGAAWTQRGVKAKHGRG